MILLAPLLLAVLVALLAVVARFGAHDLRLDQEIVGTADHDQVLGVVAPHDDKLALTVEIESIDNAEPQLPPAAAGHPQAAAEGQAEDKQNQQGRDDQGHRGGAIGQGLISTEQTQGLHKLS